MQKTRQKIAGTKKASFSGGLGARFGEEPANSVSDQRQQTTSVKKTS